MPLDATKPASAFAPMPAGRTTVPQLQGGPEAGRCLVVGVLSVTPDSFSDPGKSFHPEHAIVRGMELMRLGADIIEVGGESTRPGAARVPLAEERRRVLPVVRALAEAGAFVSIDTMRTRVVAAAVEVGAAMVTDVSGGLADPAMLRSVAGYQVPYVVMHRWGHGAALAADAAHRTVVAEAMAWLTDRIAAATAAGIAFERLVVDPGLGFARAEEHNWQLLAHLRAFHRLRRPILVGSARKSFPGRLLAAPGGPERPARGPDGAGAAIATLPAAPGARGGRGPHAAPARGAAGGGAAGPGRPVSPAPGGARRAIMAGGADAKPPVHAQ